ncbi:hypothetical protein BH11PSE2_BH11PSE2_14930 [soil metagenome]
MQFVRYLATVIDGVETVNWTRRGGQFQESTLEEAFNAYEWPRNVCFHESQKLLNAAADKARFGLENADDSELEAGLLDILKWGGGPVLRANRPFLTGLRKDKLLVAHINSALKIVSKLEFDEQRFTAGGYRSNAGYTKIYAMLAPNFVMYDSRVAGALGSLVAAHSLELGLAEVPETLAFPRMPSKSPKRKRVPVFRGRRFPITTGALHHMRWNRRANEVIRAAIDLSGARWAAGKNGMRQVEAALFMVGYDLPFPHQASPLG